MNMVHKIIFEYFEIVFSYFMYVDKSSFILLSLIERE